jgi:hypothetical protein
MTDELVDRRRAGLRWLRAGTWIWFAAAAVVPALFGYVSWRQAGEHDELALLALVRLAALAGPAAHIVGAIAVAIAIGLLRTGRAGGAARSLAWVIGAPTAILAVEQSINLQLTRNVLQGDLLFTPVVLRLGEWLSLLRCATWPLLMVSLLVAIRMDGLPRGRFAARAALAFTAAASAVQAILPLLLDPTGRLGPATVARSAVDVGLALLVFAPILLPVPWTRLERIDGRSGR